MDNRELAEKIMLSLRAVNKRGRALMAGMDQNFSDWRMLRMIIRHFPNGAKPSEIASHMGIALPTVSQKLYALEQQGYVSRTPSKTDRRVIYIFVTEKGKQITQENHDKFVHIFMQALSDFGEDKAYQLLCLIEEFGNCLNEIPTNQEEANH